MVLGNWKKDTPSDPEAGWPPRFGDRFLTGSGLVLAVGVFGLLWLLHRVFKNAALFHGGANSARDAAAFVLFMLGVVALAAGMFFALVEARKPVEKPVAVVSGETGTDLVKAEGVAGVVPTKFVGDVADSFSGRKVSVVLFAVAFALVTLAAAGSGLVSLSVGSESGAATSTPSPTPSGP